MIRILIIGFGIVLFCTGCHTLGPPSITRDRFDYIDAISTSWKKQMLLNLVKLRYSDAPVFLDVSSIIGQYGVEMQLNGLASWNAFLPTDSQTVTAGTRYVDRPTITYSPLSGDKFTRNLLTPIKPSAVLGLVEAGWPVDRVFNISIQSINGIRNRSSSNLFRRHADPNFYPLISAMKRIQQSGAVGIRVEKLGEGESSILTFNRDVNDSIKQDQRTVRNILGFDPNAKEFRLTYGSVSTSPNHIAVITRSMFEILQELSSNIDVPEKDINEGRVTPSLSRTAEESSQFMQMIHICSGAHAPPDAFVLVKYRDGWFWIDDCDPRSKASLSFLMILFSLTETGVPAAAPLVSVPIN